MEDKKLASQQSVKSDSNKRRFSLLVNLESGVSIAKSTGQRKSALRQSIKRRAPSKNYKYKIYLDNEDVTPLPLYFMFYEEDAEPQMDTVDTSDSEFRGSKTDRSVTIFGVQNLSKFQTQLHHQTLGADSQFRQSYTYTTVHTDEDVYLIEPTYAESIASVESLEEALQDRPTETTMPAQVTVILTETSTFYICDLPSYSAVAETDEAKWMEDDNEKYEYLTVGKGKNRKVLDAQVQTLNILTKAKTTDTPKISKAHNYAFASNWDMYDSYAKDQDTGQHILEEDEDEMEDRGLLKSLSHFQPSTEEQAMCSLFKNPRFQEALIIMERLLANNNFNVQQKRFRGIIEQDPFREDIDYKYNLDLLWTFANDNTKGKSVMAADWNPGNNDVLAVAYGKFYFKDAVSGMVLIWNIKNPMQPERQYNFDAPVTSLQFSKQQHNLLAVGLHDGKVFVLDISECEKKIYSQSAGKSDFSYEPVWQVLWHQGDEYYKEEDHIFTAGQDGFIRKYRKTGTIEMKCQRIMQVMKAEGTLKGIETMKRCNPPGIQTSQCSAALVIASHPADSNVYYVGTDEGVIHKCSIDYYHQHLDLFLAHEGPLYEMKFSPFCNKLFLTCGDDWTMRLWCIGIPEPLLDLTQSMHSVQAADWSPIHSTVIACISATKIYLWDIQRKAYLPQSVTESPTECRNTVVQFTPSGRCLLVGDTDGNAHIFALQDMPFPPFFQEDLLSQALRKAMITKPELLKLIKKIGRLSFDKSEFEKHFH